LNGEASTASINTSHFISNEAEEQGGAIANGGGLGYGGLYVQNSVFENNSAGNGAAIGNSVMGSAEIATSVFSDNIASFMGGAIFNSGGILTVSETTLAQNQASGDGGAIFSTGSVIVTRSTITQNQAGGKGGAIAVEGLAFENIIENSTITGNLANYGGAISIGGHAGLSILNNTLVSNQATYGSEVWKFTGSLSDLFFINTIAICASEVNSCIVSTPPLLLGNSIIETGIPESFGLGPLADNGGPTQTMALLPGSPAIDMGNDYYCKDIDQRGVARPQGSQCDIGAFEYLDDIPPDVSAVTRANSNPTALPNATFTVAFSEPVTGVDENDFELVTSGVTGASITGVSGSEDVYTVTVDTGSGNGSIRLDLIDDDSIEDLSGNKLGGIGTGNGDFISGEFYTVFKLPPKPVGIPRLSLPRRNAITNVPAPTFNWGSVLNAQGYEIVIATDSAFTQVVLSETVSSPTFTPSVPLDDGRHFWRVRALNSAAQPGRFSRAQAFTIDTTAPNVPALTSPMDTASLRSTPVFRWSRVAGAVLYEFQYDNDDNFSSPTYSSLVRTNYRKPPAMQNGTHFWRVRARDAAGNWSDWSPAFTVTISR
jgi:predicted outer membrane repeat protein